MTRHRHETTLRPTPSAPRWPAATRHARVLLVVCGLVAGPNVGALATEVTPAYAGQWIQVSCVNPNQSAAPSEGWSSFYAGSPGYGSTAGTNCGPGSPMYGLLSTAAAAPVGASENLAYYPPGGSSLVGGSLDVTMSADGYGQDASGTAVAYSPAFAYDGSDVFFQCAAGQNPCANGTNDFSGVLALPANRGGSFYLGAGCGGVSGQQCDQGGNNGAWSLVQVWWANFLLSNSANPAASAFIGTLLAANARGTQDLAFTASDPGGPGVYAVTAQIDGATVYSGTPDSDGGDCVAVGSGSGALMFDYAQPCKTSESVDLPIDTAAVADGPHTLKVTVTDAAQNSSVVYDATISTLNAPANSSAPTTSARGADLFVGNPVTAKPGFWATPSGAGTITYSYQWQDCDAQGSNCAPIAGANAASYTAAPSDVGHTLRVAVSAADNDGFATATSAPTSVVQAASGSLGVGPGPGTPPASGQTGSPGPGAPNGRVASVAAVLRLGTRGVISRSFAQRAFSLPGRLLNAQGQPIAGATLDVLAQVLGSSRPMSVVARATTRAGGEFSAKVPAGPSRLVAVAYRAFSNGAKYSARAQVLESVAAGVTLNVTPRRTSSTGTIVLSGRVLGPIPPNGVVVELLVDYLGQWEPFRTPQTNAAGRFRVAYQFQGGLGRFPFRAQVRSGQAGFPFTLGQSRPVNVTTR